jgi:hypothetical protein
MAEPSSWNTLTVLPRLLQIQGSERVGETAAATNCRGV